MGLVTIFAKRWIALADESKFAEQRATEERLSLAVECAKMAYEEAKRQCRLAQETYKDADDPDGAFALTRAAKTQREAAEAFTLALSRFNDFIFQRSSEDKIRATHH